MNYDLIQPIGAIIAALLTGGGIGAYFQYRATRPEILAKANDLNITAEIKVSDKWQEYARRMEERGAAIETRYEQIIAAKDEKIRILEEEVEKLERELERYRKMKLEKAERSRDEMHKSIDKEVDSLNRDESFQHEDFKHKVNKK